MITRIDSNGKIFTDRVRKERVACIIQTITQRIRGEAFKTTENRMLDDLNGGEQFIALTAAEILGSGDEVLARAEFMVINKQHIVWVLPAEDRSAEDQEANA
jgi:hypothetical protein